MEVATRLVPGFSNPSSRLRELRKFAIAISNINAVVLWDIQQVMTECSQ